MLRFRKLVSSDALDLGVFFEKNNTNAVTDDFCPFPLTSDIAESLLSSSTKDLFFLLEQDEKKVGFSMLRGFDEGYEIPSLGMFVGAAHQGQGLGRELLEQTCAFAQLHGINSVRLSVFEDNERAFQLYQKLGFCEIDRTAVHERSSLVMKKSFRKAVSVFSSTACLKHVDESFSECVGLWLEKGFRNIEVSYYPGLTEQVLLENASRIPSIMLHAYVPFGDENIFFNLASPDESARAVSMAFAKKRIEVSSKIRARYYAIHAGFVHDPTGRDKTGFTFPEIQPGDVARAEEVFGESIAELAAFANSQQVTLLIENNVMNQSNNGKLLLVSPKDYVRNKNLFKKYGARILFDIGHAKVSRKTEDDSWELTDFLQVSEYIEGMHLHDNDDEEDRHFPFTISDENVELITKVAPGFVTLEGRYSSLNHLHEQLLLLEGRLHAG